MTVDFADLHDEVRAVARAVLAAQEPEQTLDRAVPAAQGWFGLEAPEELDGAGVTFAETAVVLEELGRAAIGCRYVGPAVLGVGALLLVAPGPDRDALLRELAAGTGSATVALDADSGAPFRLEPDADGWRVHGHAEFVLDTTDAERLLLPAVRPDGTPVLVAVPAAVPGLTRAPRPVVDATRDLAAVTADGVAAPAAAVWEFRGDGVAALETLRHRAAVAIALDSLGLSAAMLDRTVAYAKARTQFGRAIGSFQAVKHACADMLVRLTVSRQLVAAAVRALAAGDPDAGVAAAMAKAHACAAAVETAGAAMQLHGGIGYTWESGVHRYLKRATLNRALFGTPAAHRAALAARHV